MRRLFKLKAWLTLEEAARHLAILFNEPVVVADVLRLGLDGHLTLSADFVNQADAQLGRVLPYGALPQTALPAIRSDNGPGSGGVKVPDGVPLEKVEVITADTRYVNFDKKVSAINGVWDLAMIGNERLDIEHHYQHLVGGPPIKVIDVNGTFVKRSDELWAKIQSKVKDRVIGSGPDTRIVHGSYFPASELPHDAVIVVRTDALREFERHLMGNDDVQDAPYFDADAPDYPELLHIAVRAWEKTRQGSSGTPKQRVQEFLAASYPALPQRSRDMIAQVVNWQPSGGRPRRKSETGG